MGLHRYALRPSYYRPYGYYGYPSHSRFSIGFNVNFGYGYRPAYYGYTRYRPYYPTYGPVYGYSVYRRRGAVWGEQESGGSACARLLGLTARTFLPAVQGIS